MRLPSWESTRKRTTLRLPESTGSRRRLTRYTVDLAVAVAVPVVVVVKHNSCSRLVSMFPVA